MYYCASYPLAVAFCVVTMFCWGSWGNAQKLAGDWPYRHFYWDFAVGMVVFAALFGLTAGSCGGGAWGFAANLRQASAANIGSALLGGLIFNAALILLVKSIDMIGLAVAFPVCNGLSIALGTAVNYFVAPKGDPAWIFGGIALITLAVVANAVAGKLKGADGTGAKPGRDARPARPPSRGIAVAVVSGVLMSFFYSFVARTIDTDFAAPAPAAGRLTPYAAFFLFVVGAFLSTFFLNPVRPLAYFKGGRAHLAGFLGAAVWAFGTCLSFVSAGPAGAAIAFGLGQGATLVSAAWGIFVWREFREAPSRAAVLNAAFFILFVAGLAALIKAGA